MNVDSHYFTLSTQNTKFDSPFIGLDNNLIIKLAAKAIQESSNNQKTILKNNRFYILKDKQYYFVRVKIHDIADNILHIKKLQIISY